MGNRQTKMLKNYELTYTPASHLQEQKNLSKTAAQAYSTHLLPEALEVPAYSLKSKTHLNSANLKGVAFNKPECITLLTYNVWFEEQNVKNRYPCIMRMLADSKADIICLQEVNSNFLAELHQSAKLLTEGCDYYIPIMKMHWYDTLILSKYPCRFYKKPFQNSGMGRCNLTAVIEFAQENSQVTYKLGINCVHLESLNCTPHRIGQLKVIQTLNEGMTMSIIAGDFNFTDGWAEDKAISSYIDVWKTGKKHFSKWSNEEMRELGYTMPPTTQFPPWRPDHIIYKCKNQQNNLGENEIGIIGDFTIPPFEEDHFTKIASDGLVRTPSDHFGLISKISLP